ncbi:F-box domain protein, partial [Oesophagostomum dentatum]
MVEEHASISTLPPEMIEKILRNVNPNDIGKMQQVCVQWRNILKRRRHVMRRLKVTSICIYDSDMLTVMVSHDVYSDRMGRAIIKLPEYADLFDCLWMYAPKSLVIDASKNNLRKSLEAMPD